MSTQPAPEPTPQPTPEAETPVLETPPAENVDATPQAAEAPHEEEARGLLSKAGLKPDGVRGFPSVARALAAEVERLKPLAEEGARYRADLTEAMLVEAVRAGYKRETYAAIAKNSSLETIRGLIEDFGAKAETVFKGGRKVDETLPPQQKQETKELKLNAAYAG